MRTVSQLLIISLICCGIANAQDATFALRFDGVVAEKLAPSTTVRMWSPYYDGKPSIVKEYTASDFPREFDPAWLGMRGWIVEFRNDQGILFSIELSPDLFDEPREISVKLDAPRPLIRPVFAGPGDIRYTGNITQRIKYRDLPRIDGKTKQLMLSAKPILAIVDAQSGRELNRSEMHSGCLGFCWWSKFLDYNPPDRTSLEFVVTYDSGGLFETIVTKRSFTFHQNLHGN
ncbi:MAG: hypothetical protein JNK57_14490 [Planctomycetaceae bacterium]|nr:hypothetical protein [Planctomycetaceae bacterium]